VPALEVALRYARFFLVKWDAPFVPLGELKRPHNALGRFAVALHLFYDFCRHE